MSPTGSSSPFPQTYESCVDIKGKLREMIKNDTTDLAVVGISILTSVVEHSKSSTIMEMANELDRATEELLNAARNDLKDFPLFFHSSIPLRSACELYRRFVTRRLTEEITDFKACRKRLTERGNEIQLVSAQAKERITELFRPFFSRDNMKIMIVGGYSETVISVLTGSATYMHQSAYRFKSVLIPEGRPDGSGYRLAEALSSFDIPVTIITDASIAYHMSSHDLDFVITGAEGVVESGGIINKIGTYQAAILANEHKKPFYVAAERFRFARQYPVNQKDILELEEKGSIYYINKPEFKMIPALGFDDSSVLESDSIQISNPTSDFTPPKYITMLFTDFGIMTPSGVSDELIKLYS